MKIIRFKANKVHGYIDFDIKLKPEVNFIAGLNGSGKTTALKMIMALLTPSFEQLGDISFTEAELTLKKNGGSIIKITCYQDDEKLTLKVSGISDTLELDKSEIEFRDGRKMAFLKKKHPAIREITKLTSPMFLSLDRRFVKATRNEDEHQIYFEENYGRVVRHRKEIDDESLNEVLRIISDASSSARSKQVNEDKQLRNKIILDSFSLDTSRGTLSIPDDKSISLLRRKQTAIKKTLDTLDVPSDEFETKYEEFFDKLAVLLEKLSTIDNSKLDSDENLSDDIKKAMSEWFINQSQLERINRLFSMVEQYQNAKTRIYQQLNEFEDLVNQFLEQTDKKIRINQVGDIKIKISKKERDLSILSSGERQILIMLAHLALNKKLPRDGIFIVDEPELSLHLSWQDMFVEAIQKANPNLQIILATHSPAIIGGRNDMYVPLSGGI